MKTIFTLLLLCVPVLTGCLFSEPSPAAKGVAAALKNGALTTEDVSPLSISELGTNYLDHTVLVSWYPGPWRHLRTIVIDGSEAAFPSGADADYIFAAALKRADSILDAKMAELNHEALSIHDGHDQATWTATSIMPGIGIENGGIYLAQPTVHPLFAPAK